MKSRSTKPDWHKVTWHTRAGGLLLLLGFVPAFSFYAGMQYESLQDSSRAVSDLAAQNQLTNNPPVLTTTDLPNQAAPGAPLTKTFPSPGQSYALSLFKQPGQDSCVFILNSSNGKTIDITSLMGVASVQCREVNGALVSGFWKWLDDSTFVIDVGNGKILRINIADKTMKQL